VRTDGAIQRGREDRLARLGEANIGHARPVLCEGDQAHATAPIPQFDLVMVHNAGANLPPHPNLPIPCSRGDQAPIRGVCGCGYRLAVGLLSEDVGLAPPLPDKQLRFIPASTAKGQPIPGGIDVNAVDSLLAGPEHSIRNELQF
jgi:hypothetical protein